MAPDLGDLDIFEERLVIHGAKVGGRRLTKALFMQLEEKFTSEPGSIRAWVNFHWKGCDFDERDLINTHYYANRGHFHFIWTDSNGHVFRSIQFKPMELGASVSLEEDWRDEELRGNYPNGRLDICAYAVMHNGGFLQEAGRDYRDRDVDAVFTKHRFDISGVSSFHFESTKSFDRLSKKLATLLPRKESMTREELLEAIKPYCTPYGRGSEPEDGMWLLENWPTPATAAAVLKSQVDGVREGRSEEIALWDVITTEVPQVFL